MLLLAPLQIGAFHGVSLTSLIANLVAVPLVTFLIVPLILAAMLLHLSGPVLPKWRYGNSPIVCWQYYSGSYAICLPDGYRLTNGGWRSVYYRGWRSWHGVFRPGVRCRYSV